MFVSFGQLQSGEVVNKEDGRKRKRTKRLQDREALRLFCQIVSPSGRAFHPHIFLETMPELHDFPLDFNLRGEFIRNLLEKSYEQSLEKHHISGSQGPTPNRISIVHRSVAKHGRTILIWTSSGGEIRYTLTLYRGHDARPSLQVVGKYERQVKMKALAAGIPEPKFNSKWYGILPRDREIPRQESEIERLLRIKVPLGDLLDFLRKYEG